MEILLFQAVVWALAMFSEDVTVLPAYKMVLNWKIIFNFYLNLKKECAKMVMEFFIELMKMGMKFEGIKTSYLIYLLNFNIELHFSFQHTIQVRLQVERK